MPVWEAPEDEGEGAPRHSYNFAPGNHGIVYRADTPDWGSGRGRHDAGDTETETNQEGEQHEARYKLQSMKWGLIPFWTKRNPDYGSLMKTINCRDDSLIEDKGMWTSMKRKKRCVVIAQGFYEWLKKGKDKIPHYTKRKDGKLMCFAGLWDCVQYEGLWVRSVIPDLLLTCQPQVRMRRPIHIQLSRPRPANNWNSYTIGCLLSLRITRK